MSSYSVKLYFRDLLALWNEASLGQKENVHAFASDLRIKEHALLAYPFLALNVDESDASELSSHDLTKYEISAFHFPTVTKVITTGSRKEGLWAQSSDTDFLIECGPKLVHMVSSNDDDLICKPAKNCGFYYVNDADGKVIHPMILQLQLAPFLVSNTSGTSIVDEMKHQIRAKAALPEQLSGKDKDNVIAMRLFSWPDEVTKAVESQCSQEMIPKLKGKPEYTLKYF